MRYFFKIVVAFIIILSSESLSAQTIESQKVTDTDSENSVSDNDNNSADNALEASKTYGKKADDLLQLKKALDEQKKLLDEQNIILNKRIDELEEKQNEEELSHISPGFTPSFNMFGFFDLTFNKVKARDNGFFEGMLYDKASFLINNLNLYAKSELTPSLSVLAELRFTFSPVGEIKTMELTGISEFERADTQVLNPNTAEQYRLNGLTIERIHLTWKPKDYFGVIAGRFLTPYGIWNIDHGSPVIIGIRAP
ncbi:MAG: hypothetical protein JXR91_12805, partial [Deltaproteobacteria bacterium]|nr:hypothetical protein [Deltaproteobacteria bacterium]